MNKLKVRSPAASMGNPGLYVTVMSRVPGRFLRGMWIFTAATFPLFAIADHRVVLPLLGNSAALNLALPAVVVTLTIGLSILARVVRIRDDETRSRQRVLWFIVYGFATWHVFGLFLATNFSFGLREVFKLYLGAFTMWGMARYFPDDERFLERFVRVILLSSAVFFAILEYKHLVVFHSPFLGAHFDRASGADKNVTSWYLVFTLPYAIGAVWRSRNRAKAFVPAGILFLGWIYVVSRGAWVSVLAGLLISSLIGGTRSSGRRVLRVLALLLVTLVAILAVGWVVRAYNSKGAETAQRRALSVIRPDDVPELRSYQDRGQRVADAWHLFERSPVWGVGLGNSLSLTTGDLYTHNDYVQILAELGVVGIAFFAGVLLLFRGRLWSQKRDGWLMFSTRASFIGLLVSLLTINAYTSPLMWVFFGLALVVIDTFIDPSQGGHDAGGAITSNIGASASEKNSRNGIASR